MFQLSADDVRDHKGRYCYAKAYVRRDDVVIATARGATRGAAVYEAVRMARMALRLERDERARLALSFRAAQAEFVASYEAVLGRKL